MPASTSHDRTHYEPERHDGLSAGVPAPQVATGAERTPDGRMMKGARTIPSMGGKASKGTTRLSHRIDSATLGAIYRARACTLRRQTCAELARTVGGGFCGIIPSLFVKHASVATALAEQALDEGDRDRAVKYAEASRMHLLYARELCAKDAKEASARQPLGPYDLAAELEAAIPRATPAATARASHETPECLAENESAPPGRTGAEHA